MLSERCRARRARPGSFPRRNRIIAALAPLTIVVEAGVRSGALITAGHALELGRIVAGVPGPIDVPSAAGANALLRDGAHLIASVEDALALAGCAAPRAATARADSGGPTATVARTADAPRGLAPDEQLVWRALDGSRERTRSAGRSDRAACAPLHGRADGAGARGARGEPLERRDRAPLRRRRA